MSAADTLEKQVGPLPLGGWIAVVVGGLAIGYVVRKREVSSASNTASQTASDVNSANGLTSGVGASWQYAGAGAAATPATSSTPGTNDEWRQAVIRTLLAHGYQSATAIDEAISQYFTGNPLSQAQQAIIDTAVGYVGPTPYSVPPVTLVSNFAQPATQTPPTPSQAGSTTITAGAGTTSSPVAPIGAAPASVAVPNPGTQPAIVPNPIPGDTSVVAIGNAGGFPFVYGGNNDQAQYIAQTPLTAPYNANPAAPVQLAQGEALPAASGTANYYTLPGGLQVTYG